MNGPAYTFPLGTNTHTANATDKATNQGSGTATFTVNVTYQSLCTLSARFSTRPGVDKTLCSKLAAAQTAAASGNTTKKNNILKAYRTYLASKTGIALTTTQATILTNLSTHL